MSRSHIPFLLLLLALWVIPSCSDKPKTIEIDPAFSNWISAFTSGVIPRDSEILIRLAEPMEEQVQEGEAVDQKLFSFKPSISGKAIWKDQQTIAFIPKEPMRTGETYEATFKLSKLRTVPEEFEDFNFLFETIQQKLTVKVQGLHPYLAKQPERQYLNLRVQTADLADSSALSKVITATQNGKKLAISQKKVNRLVSTFQIDSIARTEDAGSVTISWNGKAVGAKARGEQVIEVPALGDFKITNLRVNHAPEQFLELQFSDPIQSTQDLEGIISISEVSNLTYVIKSNTVKVYLPHRISGERTVTVSRGIKNNLGYRMAEVQSQQVLFEEMKPSLRVVGSGNILPSTNGLNMPFEAVNLHSVKVEVVRIFEDNIVQFFQDNTYGGNQYLNRVAKTVLKTEIDLNASDAELKVWNRYFLDLEDLIAVEPGAIYQVHLYFSGANSAYPCNGGNVESDNTQGFTLEEESEWHERGWYNNYYYHDYYDDYADYYYDENNHDRYSPCSQRYYRHKSIVRNVLASDIGLMAKAGGDKVMHVMVNDIRTTEPMKDAVVEFYDFQQQPLASARTDEEGMVSMKLDEKPFLAVAKVGKQRGYLRLRDGEALSLSNFEVSGATVQRGIKGFLYTDRGIWRPGDSIYLSFILEDLENLLPNNHPVSFQLIDPRGKEVQRKTVTRNLNGFYDFRTSTGAEAPTGNYRAQVQVGNRMYSKTLKVETVKPNRLKIYLNFEDEIITDKEGDSKAELEVKWLHGAVAKNLRAKVDVSVQKMRTSFKGFKGFVFDDPVYPFQGDAETIFDEKVDSEGKADIKTFLQTGQSAPGMLRAHFTTKVFEEGGNFSIDRYSIPYSPYTHYVGLHVPKGSLYRGTLVTGEEHQIKVATVDAFGKPASRKKLEVKVYHLDWRWWWDRYHDDLAHFIGRESSEHVLSMTIGTNSKGEASFPLQIDQPHHGRFLVRITDPESGHSTGKIVYFDWPYWARRSRPATEFPTMLSFSADKETYDAGETVKLSFPSSEGGRALVCVESGTKVLRKYWVETDQGETRFEFETDQSMAPNVFVHVSLLQPHEQTGNDRPIRMYGVVPIGVENPESHLKPQIAMAKTIRPETTVPVTISEKDGKAMTYTLAIVDEGLLDLTRFPTPNPWPSFYAKEALGVKTWDLYDAVMGAYGAELDRILAIGGDASGPAGDDKDRKANRFEPMVRFVGPFFLPAGKSKTHRIDVPNYIGSVRVMVVAGHERAYGNAEKTVPVRKPLMVLATLPRVIGPTEKVALPVNIFAMEKQVKSVEVEVETNSMFKLAGKKRQTIHFNKPGDEVLNFNLEVIDKIGLGKVKVIARSGTEVAHHEIEIDVRAPNPEVTDILHTVLEPGESWNTDYALRGLQGTNRAVLELSYLPPIDLEKRLRYLIRYPYGCIEQTTSSAFPQLFLTEVLDLDDNYKHRIAGNMQAALLRISRFQTYSGGFSYWPGGSEVAHWGTNYAGHFMLEAEKIGYKLPQGLKQNWVRYQKNTARSWRRSRNSYGYVNDDLVQAYRLYTLAVANEPELGAMNRLREDPDLSDLSRWRLAAAYAMAGQPEVAETLIEELSPEIEAYTELNYTYGSRSRDRAMILETMVLMDKKKEGAILARQLAERLSDNRYLNTHATAYSLLSICRYLGRNQSQGNLTYQYKLDSKANQKGINPGQIALVELAEKDLQQNGKLAVTNTGKSVMYARLIINGVPLIGDQSAVSENVRLEVRYTDMEGFTIDPTKIEQGTDFMAEVKIYNPGHRGYLEQMSLDQIFPSGWEIHNTRLDEFNAAVKSDHPTYQDIRDDRVYTFFNIVRRRTKTFRVQLNATYQGRFYLPSIVTEAMYDNSIHARLPGKWVEVVPSNL